MILRSLFVVCCLFCVSVASPLAQSRGGATDPVSGTWSGVFRVAGKELPISLGLTHDGKGVVSGTLSGMPNPGEVKNGAFDVKTRALTLNLGIVGQDAVLIVLEGTVTGDTATGTLETENGPGTFEIKKAS